MERIDSSSNQRIKNWTKLLQKKERDRTGLFLAEGDHLIEEALKAGIVEVILSDHAEDYSFEPRIQVPSHIAEKLSGSTSGAHSVAVCRQVSVTPKHFNRILILDGVQDPGNLGTLIRTAVSFGFDAVFCSENTCDFYNEKVIRSTQGALFQIPILRQDLTVLVESLKKQGITVIATTLEKAIPLSEMKKPRQAAVILGNEGNGVRQELQDQANLRVRIEMNGFESLNVAVAGGIVMYHLREDTK